MDYFVYQTDCEFVTKKSMKCLKSLEAHNFFTNGFVFRPRCPPRLVLQAIRIVSSRNSVGNAEGHFYAQYGQRKTQFRPDSSHRRILQSSTAQRTIIDP